MLNEKEIRQEVSYEEALAAGIQYYVERGVPEDIVMGFITSGGNRIYWLYDIIQEEKRNKQNNATVIHLFWNDGGFLSGILAADKWKIFGQNRIFD